MLQPLVEEYYSISQEERILIEDTIEISQDSIHRHGLDGDVPTLQFPDARQRKAYADVLCSTLSRYARKQGIEISAQGMASPTLNLVFMTVVFGTEQKPYKEFSGEANFWKSLARVSDAAKRQSGPFNYLRGFSFFEQDRLHMLKPAVLMSRVPEKQTSVAP